MNRNQPLEYYPSGKNARVTLKQIRILIFFLLLASTIAAQDTIQKPKSLKFSGYITNMQSVMFSNISGNWINDNLIHNRLNLFWSPGKHFTGTVQLRNRFFSGETVKYQPGYDSLMETDRGIFKLTRNLASGNSFLMNTAVDRVYLNYSTKKMEITLGRQRINWGQTFIWNPNDIFNNYSFFDFDYEEKPGTDAARIQYYTNSTSSLQLAVAGNHDKKLTAGLLWKTNKWNYDFQLLGGLLNQQDAVAGFGWSGFIKSLGFRGEMSYFYPVTDYQGHAEQFMVSIEADYTFSNNIMIQGEFLYSQIPDNYQLTDFEQVYYQPLSVRNLSFTDYNFFLQTTIPVTPLLNFSLSGMTMPKVNGYFLGPSLEYGFSDNLFASFFVQKFYMELDQSGTIQKVNLSLAFLRIKYHF